MANFTCFWLDKIGDLYVRADTKESWPSPYEAPVGALYAVDLEIIPRKNT